MARPKKEDNAQDNPAQDNDVSKNLLNSLLNGYKEDIFNFIEDNPIKVSMGSLLLDQVITLTEGIHRFVGFTGAGKSSEAFLVIKNMMEQDPKSKAILIKSEGRLSENIKKRSGLKFVFSASEWEFGTVFVLEVNIFDTICPMLETLLKDMHSRGERLGVIIDSVDALRLKADNEKELGSEKVAGPQGLMKRFLSKMSLPISKYGAIAIMISQVSSNIRIDPYSKEPPRITSGGGGYGLLHFANYILEFEPRFNGDNIAKNPKEKPSETNPIIGHWATVTIKKSDNEKEYTKVKYPIKHDRVGGNSIWIEYEIVDMLMAYELCKKGGAWYTMSDELIEELKQNNLVIDKQYQGLDNLRKALEENPELTKYLFNRFRKMLNSQ